MRLCMTKKSKKSLPVLAFLLLALVLPCPALAFTVEEQLAVLRTASDPRLAALGALPLAKDSLYGTPYLAIDRQDRQLAIIRRAQADVASLLQGGEQEALAGVIRQWNMCATARRSEELSAYLDDPANFMREGTANPLIHTLETACAGTFLLVQHFESEQARALATEYILGHKEILGPVMQRYHYVPTVSNFRELVLRVDVPDQADPLDAYALVILKAGRSGYFDHLAVTAGDEGNVYYKGVRQEPEVPVQEWRP